MSGIIDEQGYRLNVGIILMSPEGKVFWGRRVGNRDACQFPQGGMMPGETPEQTLYRGLAELPSTAPLPAQQTLPVPAALYWPTAEMVSAETDQR